MGADGNVSKDQLQEGEMRCPICNCPGGAHSQRSEGGVIVRVLCDGTKVAEKKP